MTISHLHINTCELPGTFPFHSSRDTDHCLNSVTVIFSMKLVNLKIIITSILCILLIFIKVNTTRHNLEINNIGTGKIISNSSNVKTQYTRKNDKLPLEDILTDFNNRRRHVSDMCEQYKTDIGRYRFLARLFSVGSNVQSHFVCPFVYE